MTSHYRYSSKQTQKRLLDYSVKGKTYWQKHAEGHALQLFHDMATRVPAYKDYLRKQAIDHQKIISIQDFQTVPPIDKENYIDLYPLSQLCWDGTLHNSYMISASSGSTGRPYFWPRSVEQTAHGAHISEGIYHDIFKIKDESTLYIIAFAMGTWIAGTYMMMSTHMVAQEGYPISVVTPGLNKDEIIRLVQMGKAQYNKIILVGYPPFVKDIIDYGIDQNIDWKKYPLQFLFSGEAITEGWRSHLQEKTGFSDIYSDAINILGSADVGLIAHETPVSIALRRHLIDHPKSNELLFQTERIPSLYQFDPLMRYYEEVNHELFVTTRSGLPLCRYNTKDVGSVIWLEEIPEIKESIFKLIPHHAKWKLPILAMFGRGKFSATLYGITIFPEYIKQLLDHRGIEPYCTGKFLLKTIENSDHNQQLEIHLELKDGVLNSLTMQKDILNIIVDELPKLSSEYRHLLSVMKDKVYPEIHLHEYGDPTYFPRGIMKKSS